MGLGWIKSAMGRRGATTAAAAVAAALSGHAAHAVVAAGPENGGPSAANPEDLGNLYIGSTINFSNNTIPAYWEFTWADQATTVDIAAQGTFSTYFTAISPFGSLSLSSASGTAPTVSTTLLESTAFTNSYGSGYIGIGTGTASADLGALTLATGNTYEVAITGPVADPSGIITFNAVDVPEPASLTLLGGLLGALGLVRRRKNG